MATRKHLPLQPRAQDASAQGAVGLDRSVRQEAAVSPGDGSLSNAAPGDLATSGVALGDPGPAGVSRRSVLELIGAGCGALVAGCTGSPPERIVPYVRAQPEVTPGLSRYYATTARRSGYGVGLLVESHAGRPTKIEGHPLHPASLGATGAREQAALLELYDPSRANRVREGARTGGWSEFQKLLGQLGERGEGVHLLLEATASPLTHALIDRVEARFPAARVHFDAAELPHRAWRGAQRSFGEVVDVHVDLEAADVVVAFDDDFLLQGPASLRLAREFAEGRAPAHPDDPMKRLYVVESVPSVTGVHADHRLAVRADVVGRVAVEVLRHLAGWAQRTELGVPVRDEHLGDVERRWAEVVARDLWVARGRAAVFVGERQSELVHAVVHAIDHLLDAPGRTIRYLESPLLRSRRALPDDGWALLGALDAGSVHTLLILGSNPAYTMPGDAQFARRVRQAKRVVHLTLFENETSALAHWVLPQRHDLERWGDARAADGTLSLVQPLIEGLRDARSTDEVLAMMSGGSASERRLLEDFYAENSASLRGLELQEALARGVIADTAADGVTPRLDFEAVVQAAVAVVQPPKRSLELVFARDARFGAGGGAPNAWLRELPEPVTKVVYGNPALISVELARQQQLETGDLVRVIVDAPAAASAGSLAVEVPVLVEPAQADGSITLWLGFGRRGSTELELAGGVDVGALRTTSSPHAAAVRLEPLRGSDPPVVAQLTFDDHERHLVLRRSLARWQKEPGFAERFAHAPESILPERVGGAPQWGMVVDLSRCTGCSACVIACQAENNIPTVGRGQMKLGRAMHWMRLDRYDHRRDGEHRVSVQPMLCQHCEKAPCEYVCPVGATTHSDDGLNEMVYNRCVGTRYCSNNCPYKVRRFNFFDLNRDLPESLQMAKNPNVTVRARGVMEKCTYCVQRIRRRQIEARLERRPLSDGDVVTACEQACPSRALTFGDVSQPTSQVSRRAASKRVYSVLGELGTRPRTRYLARIDNLNPRLEGPVRER